MSSSQASLSAAVDDRKARLAKLKSLKRKQPSPSDDDHEMSTTTQPSAAEAPSHEPSPPSKDVAQLHISGRNYDPETRGPKLGFEAPPVEGPTLEDQAAEIEAEVRRKAEEEAAADRGIDLFKLQPKKPNWDLKRELNLKLEILNVRTDNAIARLVRERLEAKKAAAPAGGGSKETHDAVGESDGGLEGTAIVEGLRMREREEAEEERRERELSE